jgi:hypothetical protein
MQARVGSVLATMVEGFITATGKVIAAGLNIATIGIAIVTATVIAIATTITTTITSAGSGRSTTLNDVARYLN